MPKPLLARSPSRDDLAHYGAPAAFLLVITIAVLLVRSGLAGGHHPAALVASTRNAATTRAATTTHVTTTAATVPGSGTIVGSTTATRTATATATRYYAIQRGDTLGTVASRFGTTVNRITALNPGIDPHALQVGQRIRVA